MKFQKLVKLTFCLAVSLPALAQQPFETFDAKLQQVNRISVKALPKMPLKMKDTRSFMKLNETIQATPTPVGGARASRAAGPVAYYDVEPGVYTMVPEMYLDSLTYTTNGYVVPLNKPIEYKYINTGLGTEPVYYEWSIGQTTSNGTSATAVYTPYIFNNGLSTYTPELYVGNNSGEDTYSAGTLTFTMSDGTVEEVFGTVSLMGSGWVSNLDVSAYPGMSTSLLYYDGNDPWSSIFFGTDTVYKSAYMELFDAPKGGYASLQGCYIPVITPMGVDLTTSTFGLAFAESLDGQLAVKAETDVTGANSILKMYDNEAESITQWVVFAVLDKPVMVNNQWAVLIQGPQDGTKWAMRCQVDRLDDGLVLNDETHTAFSIFMEGEYAGYIIPTVTYQGSDGTSKPYPTSLDIYPYVAYPWFSLATDTYLFGDTIPSDAEGGVASAFLASYSYVDGLTVTSDSESWLTCTTSPYMVDGVVAEWLLNVAIDVKPLPADVAGRKGNLTFTDIDGYSQVFTIVQGDAAAGIDQTVVKPVLDPNAPIYDVAGRLVTTPVKGIYFQNGRKFIVK